MNIRQFVSDYADYIKNNIRIPGGYDTISTIVLDELDLDKYKNKVLLAVHIENELDFSDISNESLLGEFTLDIDFIFQGYTESKLKEYQDAYFEAFFNLLQSKNVNGTYSVPIKATFFDYVEGRENAKALEIIVRVLVEI